MGRSVKIAGIGVVVALGAAGYFFIDRRPLPDEPAAAPLLETGESAPVIEAKASPDNAPAVENESVLLAADTAETPSNTDDIPETTRPDAAVDETGTDVVAVTIASPAPEVSTGLEAALPALAVEGPSGQSLQPESAVNTAAAPQSATAPDAVLPAPATAAEPAQGASPRADTEAAGTLTQEAAPLLGEASLPLTLAQVLPPGEAPAPDQIAPSFDLVRVSPDGSAVIAGRAAPGANVQVFSGTIPVAEATASARGEFVVFLDAPSATTLDLQIPAAPEGAQLVVSQDDIIILPAAPDAESIAPTVLHRTPDAVKIIQPAGPAIPGNVSLDLVSYSDSGAVQLAGRGRPGNVARIYADGQLAGEAPITGGGNWALEVSDIAEGRYVLRVDEITPAGEVLSRTESPFQRQFPEANLPESFSQGAKIIVQPGNTLWLMATEAYGDGDAYSQIFSANKDAIRDPDLIYPGQIFAIPRIEE